MNSFPSGITPNWKPRLLNASSGILIFEEHRQSGELRTSAESPDSRTILELVEKGNELTRASLQLALPTPDDLEMLKLSCWALLFLKSLFPGWEDLATWVQVS